MTTHFIIGAGGIGCWLTPLLKKMAQKGDRIKVMDGDELEERNFDRQLHDPTHIGWNKAEALYYTWGLNDFYPRYLTKLGRPAAKPYDWVWCCVDNHAARMEVLEWADEAFLNAVLGGNEYAQSQAFIYHHPWRGTQLDPRVRYPEILTDRSNDPTHPNCQGQAQVIHPQLALHNYLAAGMMVHLYQFWLHNQSSVSPDYCPVEHHCNFTMLQTYQVQHVQPPNEPIRPVYLDGNPVPSSEVDRSAPGNI